MIRSVRSRFDAYSWTRTNDPIDVNDVLSALRTFVEKGDY